MDVLAVDDDLLEELDTRDACRGYAAVSRPA